MITYLLKFIVILLPLKSWRKNFRDKYIKNRGRITINADLKSNNIVIPKNSNRNIKIKIKGRNNIITIAPSNDDIVSNIKIIIHGDNNNVTIESAEHINLSLNIGYPDARTCNNAKFFCGEGTFMNGASCFLLEPNTEVKIGKECMISWNVEMRCTDDHSILDYNNNVLNNAKSIVIGNHVWLCKDVLILKNTTIPDGCIVGTKSVVASKRFTQTNCGICGNPAKVVKEGIHWDIARPDLYQSSKSVTLQGQNYSR